MHYRFWGLLDSCLAANAPGIDRGTTEGQMAACYLPYEEATGQNIRSITQEQN